ncbi:DUF7373 family lipoprotein [Nocardia sp. NPDC003979]
MPEVDIGKLDSGNYPTRPVDIEATRQPLSGAIREAVMLGVASPSPHDYDHRFVYHNLRVSRALTAGHPPWYSGADFENREEALAAIPGVVAGWQTAGARRDSSDTGRRIDTMVVRYTTENQARFAYEELARRTEGVPGEVPGYAEAHVRVAIIKDIYYTSQKMYAWMVRGDLLVHAALSDPVSVPFDAAANADIIKRFFDKQLAMLANYSPTPVAEIDRRPFDVDGLLSRTLPADERRSGAVYPRQALLHMANRPDQMGPAMADAGVDFAAFAGASVYRTRDAAAATRYLAAESADTASDSRYTPMDGPAAMPGTRCYNSKPGEWATASTPPLCMTTVGRYVIAAVGANPQETYQRLAAQYKLLAGHP